MRKIWTQEQTAEVMDMRFRQRMKFREIGKQVGRSAEQVAGRIARVIDSETDQKHPGARVLMRSLGGAPRPPVEVLVDRDRRVNAPRTPNMEILGDPIVPRWNSNAAP